MTLMTIYVLIPTMITLIKMNLARYLSWMSIPLLCVVYICNVEVAYLHMYLLWWIKLAGTWGFDYDILARDNMKFVFRNNDVFVNLQNQFFGPHVYLTLACWSNFANFIEEEGQEKKSKNIIATTFFIYIKYIGYY